MKRLIAVLILVAYIWVYPAGMAEVTDEKDHPVRSIINESYYEALSRTDGMDEFRDIMMGIGAALTLSGLYLLIFTIDENSPLYSIAPLLITGIPLVAMVIPGIALLMFNNADISGSEYDLSSFPDHIRKDYYSSLKRHISLNRTINFTSGYAGILAFIYVYYFSSSCLAGE